MQLTPAQLTAFDEEGYLFLPECFSDEEVAALRRDAEAIYRSGREEVWQEKSGAPRSIGSSMARARSFPRHGAPLSGFCRRASARICSLPITGG